MIAYINSVCVLAFDSAYTLHSASGIWKTARIMDDPPSYDAVLQASQVGIFAGLSYRGWPSVCDAAEIYHAG